jgi:site-specific DNA recombinase
MSRETIERRAASHALQSDVRRLTRLAYLASRIVEAVVAGHQPPELTSKALTERFELPLIWNEQERTL